MVVVVVADRVGAAAVVVVVGVGDVAMTRRRRIPARGRSRRRRVRVGLRVSGLAWRAVRRLGTRPAAADSGTMTDMIATTPGPLGDPDPGLVPAMVVGTARVRPARAARGLAHVTKAPATDRPAAVKAQQRKIKT